MQSNKPSLLIITHYYPPEIGAPQARLSEMAELWSQSVFQVTVITCFPNHPTGIIPNKYQGKKYLVEIKNNIKICRCQTFATPNKGFIKKLIGHLVFMINVVRQAGKEAKNNNIILVSSPTFFSVISAYWLSKKYNKPYIFEVRDLWPAIFKELDIIKNKWVLKILETLELYLYKKAIAVVTVTQSFTENIKKRGILFNKVYTVSNGVNLEFFKPKQKDIGLIESLSLQNQFIVLYIGAHGLSHGLEKIVDVANKLKENRNIHFLFVGEGAKKEELIKKAHQLKLSNISFISGQPKEKMPDFYSIADTVLVTLKNIPLFDTFIPSKIFEIMAMEKPIIASLRGESADILKESKGALVCEPEDVDATAQNIMTLYNQPEMKSTLGNNGLLYVKRKYDRIRLAKKYERIFQDILNRR